jgi:alkanesulfonate monooxygenase SsuD/methylene tetrahydromethanopterin reductase-like flavin-dependent oxidoreductase (luciferase family)
LCTQFRNPALLAKMAATLDEISGGRLTLGLGAGWHQPEFDAFGVPFDHRVARFDEAVRIIKPLLRDGRVDFEGTYYSARNCELVPRGPRPAGPPLMLAGARPRMLSLAARYADAWNTAWHHVPASVVTRLESVRVACDAAGRDPSTLQISASVAVGYAELGPLPWTDFLTGGASELGDALHGYAELGVAEVIVEFAPFTVEVLDRFAAGVEHFRAGGG